MERTRIAVIGAGNVATHLARALDRQSDVVQVCSRNIEHAASLASTLRACVPICDFGGLATDCDYYIIAVNDDSITQVSAAMPQIDGVVAHTSGSVSIDALSRHRHRGVMYPLQTFSAHTDVDIKRVPFFIEGADVETTDRIMTLAGTLSAHLYLADSDQRAALHVAAVFGCNFTNHLLEIADTLLSAQGYPLSVLEPLLEVTMSKAMSIGPHDAQTGPAVRRDMGVITKHLGTLDPKYAEIYRLLTRSIMERTP